MSTQADRPRRLLFFASDGMRHDLMARYVAAGAMPVFQRLLARGVSGAGGCLPALPTNTGAGWATLQTGAWSGTSGAINNVFHATDTPITEASSGFDARLLQAETLAQAAERQGLSVACVEWPGTLPATCAGPVIDFRTFYSARGALLRHDPPGYRSEIAARLGLADLRSDFPPATGWRNAPPSTLPPREAELTIASTRPAENPDRVYHAYVYATSATGYDRVLIAERRDGMSEVATLRPGEWAPVRVRLSDGRLAGLHFKLIALAPDLAQCWLAFTTISRARASRPDLEDLLASEVFAVPETADHGPIEAGLVDAETYVEQGLMFYANVEAVYRHAIEAYQPDLLFAGAPVTDEFSHQFMACVTPAYPGYDPAQAARYERYLRAAYAGADRLLGFLLEQMPDDALVAVSADHGFGAAWRSINANLVLERAGLLVADAAGQPLPQSRAVAFWAGGTCNVYVNLAGREPGGVVPAAAYASTCERIKAAFLALNGNGERAIDAVYGFEETGAIPTSCGPATMRFAGRSGDVVVFAAPPHQFDAPDAHELIAPSPLLGQHGYLPDAIDERLNVNMRPPLLLAGPGVPAGLRLPGARAIDLAPTLAALLGIEPPAQADGRDLLAGEA
ncbi:MAG TPA: alkaline phosphatase family protein [Dehalococcoidia bacterium]|nr:alkaline phosphatase family protein [Dehalococcoidia bacterium]